MKEKNLKEASINELSNELALRLESIDLNTLSVATSLSTSITYDIVKKVLYSIFSISENKELKVGDIVKMNNPYPKSNYGLIIRVHCDCVLVANTLFCGEYRKHDEISLCTDDEINRFKFKLEQRGIRISDDGARLERIKQEPKVGDIVRNCRFVGILTDIKNNKGNVLTYVDREYTDTLDELYLCSNREKEEFLKMLKDDNLMIGKDGISIVRWIPNFGETFWIISTNDECGSIFAPKEVERRYLDDIYYPKCFATKELAQQAIDNL
ncbi:MAG: hypothetical protein WCS51_05540 [Bacilli bacterium]